MQIFIVLNIKYENKTVQTEIVEWVDFIDEKQYKEFKIICCCLSMIGFISDNTFVKLDSSIDDLYEILSVDLAYYHCVAKNILKNDKKYFNPQILIDKLEICGDNTKNTGLKGVPFDKLEICGDNTKNTGLKGVPFDNTELQDVNLFSLTPHSFLIKDDDTIIEEILFT